MHIMDRAKALMARVRDYRFHNNSRHIIVTWEHKRIARVEASPDHPYFYDEGIVRWCRDNIDGPVYLRMYNRITNKFKSRVCLSDAGLYYKEIGHFETYAFIRSTNDSLVRFMELDFPTDGDRALFLLAWQGRVEKIDAVPFYECE